MFLLALAILVEWEARPQEENIALYLLDCERVTQTLVEVPEVTTFETSGTSLDLAGRLPEGDYLLTLRARDVWTLESRPSFPAVWLAMDAPDPDPPRPLRPVTLRLRVAIEESADLQKWTVREWRTIELVIPGEEVSAERRKFFRIGNPMF